MSVPVDQMRTFVPQGPSQIQTGDAQAAQRPAGAPRLGGRSVQAAEPGEARAVRLENHFKAVEPLGALKRFLMAIFPASWFSPETRLRAATYDINQNVKNITNQLNTGHLDKQALFSESEAMRNTILRVSGNANREQRELGGALMNARISTMVSQLSDHELRNLRDNSNAAMNKLAKEGSSVQEMARGRDLEQLPDSQAKEIELGLRNRDFDQHVHAVGLTKALFDAAEAELAARYPTKSAEPSETSLQLIQDTLNQQFLGHEIVPHGSSFMDSTTQNEVAGKNQFYFNDKPLFSGGETREQRIKTVGENLIELFGSEERAAKFSRLTAGQGLNMLSGMAYKDAIVSLKERGLENEYMLSSIVGGDPTKVSIETRLNKEANGDVIATMNRRFPLTEFNTSEGNRLVGPDSYIDVKLPVRISADDKVTLDKPNLSVSYHFTPPNNQ